MLSVFWHYFRWRSLIRSPVWTSGRPPCFSASRRQSREMVVIWSEFPVTLWHTSLLIFMFYCDNLVEHFCSDASTNMCPDGSLLVHGWIVCVIKTSVQGTRITYGVSIVSIKTLFYLMTSVVFYPFSAEIMQLKPIHYLSFTQCVAWKNVQRINVYLYVLYLHCNVVPASSLHDKCSDFNMRSHSCALYFETTIMYIFISD